MLRCTWLALILVALGGCAGYRLTPVSPQDYETTWSDPKMNGWGNPKEGYIFYEPMPYLLGTRKPDSNAVYEFELVYLPNYSRPYRFTRYELFAKSDLKITFHEGWQFTGAESSTDTTSALEALAGLAKSVFGMNAGDQLDGNAVLIPIEFENGHFKLGEPMPALESSASK